MEKSNLTATLPYAVNGRSFEWHHQYILGIQAKESAGIRPEETIFLVIPEPWEDELIHNDTRVDLARPGVEHFVTREKHPEKIILTIQTTMGTWENGEFSRNLTVAELIAKVVKRFEFSSTGNYALKIKSQSGELDKTATLGSLHLKDCTILTFVDLGGGAGR
jgi:hypothetical protein